MENLKPQLQIRNSFPENFLDLEPTQAAEVLGNPTLFCIEGERNPPLLVSTLLHGNETSGFKAIQEILKTYKDSLPRSLLVFIGNVHAAARSARHLSTQPDYNRIWAGGDLPEHAFAQVLLEEVKKYKPFVAVDIHNTTGANPHYACTNHLGDEYIALASIFSDRIVYFEEPGDAFSKALSPLCPSVTIECGKSSEPMGVEHARQMIENCLNLDRVPTVYDASQNPTVYHSFGRIKVANGASIEFVEDLENCTADVCFVDHLEKLNFTKVKLGDVIGRMNMERSIQVLNESYHDIIEEFFDISDGFIKVRRAFVPSLLTRDVEVIHQDCLGYAMREIRI